MSLEQMNLFYLAPGRQTGGLDTKVILWILRVRGDLTPVFGDLIDVTKQSRGAIGVSADSSNTRCQEYYGSCHLVESTVPGRQKATREGSKDIVVAKQLHI